MIDSTNILLKAGMTQGEIMAGRVANIADRMRRDIELAALLVTEGAKVWQEIYPETPPEKLAEWAKATLSATRRQLNGDKPSYPEPYDALIPNQQAYVDSLPDGDERQREQQVLDNMREEAAMMVEGQ